MKAMFQRRGEGPKRTQRAKTRRLALAGAVTAGTLACGLVLLVTPACTSPARSPAPSGGAAAGQPVQQKPHQQQFAGGWAEPPADAEISAFFYDVAPLEDGGTALESAIPLPGRPPGTSAMLRFRLASPSDPPSKSAAFAPAPGEELWVIAQPSSWDDPTDADATPGTGALLCVPAGADADRIDHETLVPIPLQHTAVSADIDGYIGSVRVEQRFANPFSEKIEAVYSFPLPQNAAVNGFVMEIGDRRIRGVVREREEAERIYNDARSRGHVASLLTQQRPNIFTQKVANIEPGKRIDVDITYFHTLAFRDGAYEWVFPMTIGPRFNPPASEDPVVAAPRGSARPDRGTAVTYLAPDERSGHDVSLEVRVDAGVPIESLTSPSHAIDVSRYDARRATVSLSPLDRLPNRDFVLRVGVSAADVRTGLITHRDDTGNGYFSLMIVPPAKASELERRPIELVFVLDTSGSMRGEPMQQSKQAMRTALRSMRPDDTFQIVRFSSNASSFGPRPVPATPDNIRRALRYVDELSGGGGTMMASGVRAALDFPHDPERLRFVCFLTDGFIGNESGILGLMAQRLGPSRVFSFGVGSSPNRFLLERMAQLGRGAVAYLGPGDSGSTVMSAFFERAARPALTDVRLDFGGAEVFGVYPTRPADVFAGRPVIVTGRFRGSAPTDVRVLGSLAGRALELPVSSEGADGDPTPALAAVWARTRIAELMNTMAIARDANDRQGLKAEVRTLALKHQLMSAYTSFIAVDPTRVTAGESGVSVDVPVLVPEGVRYETTVR
jgi:Ca-activated chloride channel family protein